MVLTEFQKKVLEVSSKTKGPAGYAAKSSIQHLHRAFELADSMPEISAFLAITAEEEASTALFQALKNKKYTASKALKKNVHKHKAGVYPFLMLVGETLNILKHELPIEITFEIPSDENNELIKTRMFIGGVNGIDTYIYPDPPLNLVSVDPSGKAKDYLRDVKKVAQDKGISSIFGHIKEVANIRNKMLYASDTAIPCVRSIGELLERHLGATFLIHIIYLFVVQNPKQNIVEECLNVFMKIQHRLEHAET
ncbi:hypothetical protein LY624_19500 [Pseudoalteromonas sp. N1230-9]|uniref:hypothetical protein n=1 Tax=Pseudoalteromonas sp. N1230-9 TaxID=2907156 RepID=UPI002B288220|nr:hypothetical protein LY624_19500 [Pseudoalteromonas sp. N1230-9]